MKGFPVCKLEMLNKPKRRLRVFPDEYQVMRCTESQEEVKHTKMVENCQNITKQNCITEWARDSMGKLVQHTSVKIC